MLSYLWSMDLTNVSIDAIVALAKQKQTKMVFWLRQLMNNHTASWGGPFFRGHAVVRRLNI